MSAKRPKTAGQDPEPDLEQEAGAEAGGASGEPYDMEELCRERDDLRDKWTRAQADYANLRRRTQADINAAVRRSQQGLLDGLLLAIDHLELALATPATSEETKNLALGVRLTRDQMLQSLEREGVRPVPPAQTFDPKLHEAVATVESAELAPGTILEVLRPGYIWGEVVLRPAHVKVVAEAPAREPGTETDTDGELEEDA
jgi:molecular chaperone GrpE